MSRNLLTGDLRVQNAKSHGALYNSIFNDGILQGCGLSNTATDITVDAGHFIECGRLIQIPAPETITLINPIQEGYVRLTAKIDLVQPASKDVCNQMVFEYEYSGTIGGFQNLTQDDVNATGTEYSAEFAVYQLTEGVITVLVRSIGVSKLKSTSNVVQVTLTAAGWSGGAQTVNVEGVTESSGLVVGISGAATAEQRAAAREACIYATGQGEGTVTFSYDATLPAVDIPYNVMIVG